MAKVLILPVKSSSSDTLGEIKMMFLPLYNKAYFLICFCMENMIQILLVKKESAL